MRLVLLPFCLWFSCCCFAHSQKPEIRALLAVDLVSNDIIQGDRADMYRIQKSLKGIAHQLHLPYHITTLTKESMTVGKLNKWFRSIPKKSNNIVLFYFAGHGQKSSQAQDSWPVMLFRSPGNPITETMVPGRDVYQELRAKHSRLSLIFMDACNSCLRSSRLMELSPPYRPIIDGKHRLPGLRSLFLKTKGMVTSAAAAPGEFAYLYGGRNKNSGGFFTTGLLSAIKDYGRKKNLTWKQVLIKTAEHCNHESHGKQNPIYSIQR